MPTSNSIPNSSSNGRFLENFKGRLSGGGARPNLFEVEIAFPSEVLPANTTATQMADKISFLVKATSLPASTVTPIPVPFRGRVLQIAGDRTFDPWQITVINDQDFKVRSAFERWLNWINRSYDNSGQVDPAEYQTDMWVYQLGRPLTTSPTASDTTIPKLRSYKMFGCFPTTVSGISLAYDSNNQIEEFTVDMQVQYWEAYDGSDTVDVK
ncbi:tail tube monomer protein [Synechococcus phage DSL-LC03]|nr:tail tube monomer protein [Synechococcus phage DSL-LC03]